MQGALKGLWNFADPNSGRALLENYRLLDAVTPVQSFNIPRKSEG
jgi:hypothetical protein